MDKFVRYGTSILLGLSLSLHQGVAANQQPRIQIGWRHVAGSDVIIVGSIGGSSIYPEGKDKIEEFDVRVLETLKGSLKGDIHVPYGMVDDGSLKYSDPPPPLPEPYFAERMRGQKVIVFLEMVADDDGSVAYVPTDSDFAHIGAAYTPELRQWVIGETARQTSQITRLENWRGDPDDDIAARVSAALDELSSSIGFRRDRGRDTLLEMGCLAVPYLILKMDDHRHYHGDLVLPNPPKAFEAFRQYGPKQMIDAIAAVLNQITGDGAARVIFNGGTNAEREAQYHFWLIYLAHHFRSPNPDGFHDWIGNCQWDAAIPGT